MPRTMQSSTDITNTVSSMVWDAGVQTYVVCETAEFASSISRSMTKVMGTGQFGPHLEDIDQYESNGSMTGPLLIPSLASTTQGNRMDIMSWFVNHLPTHKRYMTLTNVNFSVGNICSLTVNMKSRYPVDAYPSFAMVNTDIPHGTNMSELGLTPEHRLLSHYDLSVIKNGAVVLSGLYIENASINIDFEYSPIKTMPLSDGTTMAPGMIVPHIPTGITFTMNMDIIFMANLGVGMSNINDSGVQTTSYDNFYWTQRDVEKAITGISSYHATDAAAPAVRIQAPHMQVGPPVKPGPYAWAEDPNSPMTVLQPMPGTSPLRGICLYMPVDVSLRDGASEWQAIFGQILGACTAYTFGTATERNQIRWRHTKIDNKPVGNDLAKISLIIEGQSVFKV